MIDNVDNNKLDNIYIYSHLWRENITVLSPDAFPWTMTPPPPYDLFPSHHIFGPFNFFGIPIESGYIHKSTSVILSQDIKLAICWEHCDYVNLSILLQQDIYWDIYIMI